MATSKSKSAAQPDDVLVLDVQSLLIPASIIIGSMIIAAVLFFTGGESSYFDRDSDSGSDSGDRAVAQDDGAPAADPAPAAVTAGRTSFDDDPVLGDRDSAKVAIIEFSDYECPFCKRHHDQTRNQIVENFIDTGDAVMVFRDYPLSFHDPLATEQALAGECIQDQLGDDKYFEYGDLIFQTTTSNIGMDKSELYTLAGEVGADVDEFTNCLDSEQFAEEVAADLVDGSAAGVNGTPGFIIGVIEGDEVVGEVVSGAQPYAVFQGTIEKYLNQ